MSAWANQPYPDLNYDYNLPKEIKQIDRRIVKMLNEYFGILKVSCGTINVNTLHKMCLLKLLRDVIDSDGPLHVFMHQSEAKDWTDYIKRCFNELVYKDGAMDIDPEENVCPPIDPEPTPPGPEPTDKYIVSISVSGQTTEFYKGRPFVFDGTVTGTYNDGTTTILESSEYTYTSPNMNIVGEKSVTVTYKNDSTVSTSYTIVVSDRYINRIVVTTPSTILEFQVGDAFSFNGVVTGYYNDGVSSLDVTNSVFYDDDLTGTPGTIPVYHYYRNSVGQVIQTETPYYITVTARPEVKIPTSLTLQNPKTAFNKGDSWVYGTSSSKIIVTYSDNTASEVSVGSCVFTYNGAVVTNTITSTTGTKEILVSYSEASHTVTNSYSITVAEGTVVPEYWYMGASASTPGPDTVSNGTRVSLNNNIGTSPLIENKVFWIAVPDATKKVVQAQNLGFTADIIYEEDFDKTNTVSIGGAIYRIYMVTYKISPNVQFSVVINNKNI